MKEEKEKKNMGGENKCGRSGWEEKGCGFMFVPDCGWVESGDLNFEIC